MTITVDNLSALNLAFRAATGVGIELYSTGLRAVQDMSGDGLSDVFWRNSNGDFGVWASTGSTGFVGTASGGLPSSWGLTGRADFNSDGPAEQLWREGPSGSFGVWLSAGSGYSGGTAGYIDSAWRIAGTGEYN